MSQTYAASDCIAAIGGTRADKSHEQHMETLIQAYLIFGDRSLVRGDLWAEHDVHDAWSHAKDKLFRVQTVLERLEAAKAEKNHVLSLRMKEAINDDILDLINYAAFMYRHLNGMKP
jgi:hypothetical protein